MSTPPPASGVVTNTTTSRCPRLRAISSMPITPSRSQPPQSTVRAIQRSRMPSIVSSETLSLRAASATVEFISMRKAQCSYALVLGLRGSYHSHGCVVVGLPAQYGASIPLRPNLDEDGHIEQGQMAQAHGGIPPVNVANLPTAIAALGPFEGALDADEPVPLLGPLRRKDTHIGQVQRHLNEVVHGDSSPSESVPLSSHRAAHILYYMVGLHGNSGRACPDEDLQPIPFVNRGSGYYAARVPREVLRNSRLILGVKAQRPDGRQLDEDDVRERFPHFAKIASPNNIHEVVKNNVPAIQLRVPAHLPPEIPLRAGFTYFELDKTRSTDYWRIADEAGHLALHSSPDMFPGLTLEFWGKRE